MSLCGRDARGNILCHRRSRGSLAAAPRSLPWGPCIRPLFTSKTERKRNAKKIEQAASSPEKADIILGSKYPRGTQRSKNLHSEAARLGVSQSGRANILFAARVQNSVRSKAIIARHSRRRPHPPSFPSAAPPAKSGGAAPAQIGRRGHVSLRMTSLSDLFLAPRTFFWVSMWGFLFEMLRLSRHHHGFWVWGNECSCWCWDVGGG